MVESACDMVYSMDEGVDSVSVTSGGGGTGVCGCIFC
jgi:hypothetical protein